jgi:hypothetical protein
MKNKFIQIKASKISIAKRKLIFSMGTNDADYIVMPLIRGKQVTCPFYARWKNMFNRCYSKKYHEKYPTYIDCAVCEEWLSFTSFKHWMEQQDWEGKDLDKDIINPGNKIYDPENCRFITKELNHLLNDHAAKRGEYPQGVSYDRESKKYKAGVNIKGTSKNLGRYTTPELASAAYIDAKSKTILQAASEQSDPLISNGLKLHAAKLTKGLVNAI